MSDSMGIIIGLVCVVGVVAVAIVGFCIMVYNGLVGKRVETQNAWSQIDVQLKRRYDLIPNLVETVKGYASHEKDTFERVIQARNAAMNASGPAAHAAAENALSGTLKSLFAVAEAYPDQAQLQEIWKLYTGAVTGGSLLNLTPVQAAEPPPRP